MTANPPHRALWTYDEVSIEVIGQALQHYFVGQLSNLPVVTFMLTTSDQLYWPDQPDPAIYIHKIAVARQNVARVSGYSLLPAVFEYAASVASDTGKKYLRLDCDKTRPALANLYENCGFDYHSEIELPGYVGVRYQKTL